MALTTIQTNNKLIDFSPEINREFVRENLFSPYMGEGITSIIRRRFELKNGGEQVNIPLLTKLNNAAKGVGTLVGNEEKLESYGMRVWVDWRRNAVVTNEAEKQKDSADLWAEAKPALMGWGKEYQRDDIIAAMLALPSESAPAGLGSDAGQPVNGILYETATAAQKNTFTSDNSDRILFATTANYSATHATGLTNILTTHTLGKSSVSLMKRIAMQANPAIRPYTLDDGYEAYVLFCGTNTFRDLKNDLVTTHTTAYQNSGKGNVIFRDGDLLWDGVIVRQVPEISGFVTDVWTSLKTAGSSTTRVEPVFFCGQQALAFAWAQMAKVTTRAENDYGFLDGVGLQMCYGTAKMFKKHPAASTPLVQWGMVSGFFSGATD